MQPPIPRIRMITRAAASLFAVAALACSVSTSPAQDGEGIPPDIPLVQRLGTGARALGMGGAYIAVGEDYTSISYNPAGLALVRRVEFGAAFQKQSADNIVTYLGQSNTTPLDRGRIQSLGFAYPFPTYRGSLVFGFSYDRVAPLDQEYFRSGSGGPVQLEEETILEDGSVGAYQAALAMDVTPSLSLGITGRVYDGSSHRERTFFYTDAAPNTFEDRASVTDIDFSAVSATLGALLRSDAGVRLGLAVHLPEEFTLDGIDVETRHLVVDSTDVFDYVDDELRFEDKVKLPFRVAVGLSFAPQGAVRGLLLSGDLTYADWKQIDYDGPIRAGRDYAYRATTDIRVGAEYAFRAVPVRLRAGFISQPLAYRAIATDVFAGQYQNANLVKDRRYGTVGAGVLLDQSLTLDAAWVFGGYERTGVSSATGRTTEKLDDNQVVIGAAFRL